MDGYYAADELGLDTSTPEGRAVSSILADLTSRRGLRQEFEDCDPGTQAEIASKWAQLVQEAFKP